MGIDRADRTPDALEHLAQRRGIRLMLQFGSTVSGTHHPHSDLDIAIMFEAGDVPLSVLNEISEELRERFPGREIDLVLVNRADPLFLKKITEQCRLLYGKEEDLARLRVYAFKRYQDHRRFLALERRFVSRRLAVLCTGSGAGHD